MGAVTVISKLMGIGAAGALLYDAHNAGKVNSKKQYSAQIANSLPDIYSKSIKLDGYSEVGNSAKKNVFRWALDDGVTPAISSAFGYVTGTIGHLVDNVLTAGLATTAILAKGKAGKPSIVGAVAAAGLVLTAGKYLLYDVFGVGKPKPFSYKT